MSRSRLPTHRSVLFIPCLASILAVGLLMLWLRSPVVAQPPLPSGGDESQTFFTHADGLESNGVTALLQDDRSLWIGTPAGLSRYTIKGRDAGLLWQTFSSADGLAADAISHLWTDDAGDVWVAHPDGAISVFNGDVWTTYENVTETLSTAFKHIIEVNADGPLWAIEEGGRVWTLAGGRAGYYSGGVWRPFGADPNLPRGAPVYVWTWDDGAWIATDSGQIGYFDGANWTTYFNLFDMVQRQVEIIAAAGPTNEPLWVVDASGAVWVRNAFNNNNPRPDVRRFAEGRWTNFSSADGMAAGFVAELRLDEYGRVWARHVADANGVGGGLSLFDGQRWSAITPPLTGNVTDFSPAGTTGVWIATHFQPAGGGAPVGGLTYVALDAWERYPLTGFQGAAVSDVWLDENDDLWLGLSADPRRSLPGGLWRYRPARGIQAAQWTPVEGLLAGGVSDLWGDGQDSLWAATPGGVNRIALDSGRRVSYTLSLRPDRIAGDQAGNLWAVMLGEGGGVMQWDGDVWASHTVSDGLSGGVYADMLVANDGALYLAGDRGLDTWDGDAWKTFAALPGLHVRRVWQDALGELWVTTEITPGRPFNLSFNPGGGWQTVLSEAASPAMGPTPLALLRDSRGLVWLGAPLGLFTFDPTGDEGWHGVGPADGLPAGAVSALYEDANGVVWVAVGEQVYATDGGQWRAFAPGVGLVSRIGPGPAGSLLFSGETGVALYRPRAPGLRLDGVTHLAAGKTFDGRDPVVLTLGRDAIRIDLTAIAPTLSAQQLAYRYRLEGFDLDWRLIPASALGGKQAALTYAGLPGGVYTFTAAARSDALAYGPSVQFSLRVISRPPRLVLDGAAVAGRPVEHPGALRAYVSQPIQFRLSANDDQLTPLAYRYRVEGLGEGWTDTLGAEISFTLSAAGVYTFVAQAVDDEGQSSAPVGAQIVVSEWPAARQSRQLPVGTIAAGMGVASAVFIGMAVLLIVRRKRRESW